MPEKSTKTLKVFIGCPGDQAPERDLLLSLEKKLAKRGCPVEFCAAPRLVKFHTAEARAPVEVEFSLKTAREVTADDTDYADDAEEEGLGFLPRIVPGLTYWVSALPFTTSASSASSASSAVSIAGFRFREGAHQADGDTSAPRQALG